MAYNFKIRDFVDETHPAYYDNEGDSPYRIKIISAPTYGSLELNAQNYVPNTVFHVADIQNLEYFRSETELEAHVDSFDFQISDAGSRNFSNVGTIRLHISKVQTPPTVDDNSDILDSNRYTYKLSDFTKNYSDSEGDNYLDLIITSLPEIGTIRHNGAPIISNKRIKLDKVDELQFILPDRYALYDGTLYEFTKDINEIILDYEASGYILRSNEDGVLTFTKLGQSHLTKVVRGLLVPNNGLCIDFQVSEDSAEGLLSNEAEFCLIPQGDTNIAEPYINQPPTVGNISKSTEHGGIINFSQSDFTTDTLPPYEDIEDDDPDMLRVESLPTDGTLFLQGVPIVEGQEINIYALSQITYKANVSNTDEHSVNFTFRIKDEGSGEYSNVGIVTINVQEKVASPPTVEGSGTSLSENVYIFEEGDFTTNFQDPDEDNYELTRIESLPTTGDLFYEDSPVVAGHQFPLTDVSKLEFRLPDNYELNPNGYCVFEDSVDNIINQQLNEGFSLINREIGLLEFQKSTITQVPNDTDIYAFFDTTSMNYADAVSASDTLRDWYEDYKISNDLYEGNLYIIPVDYESWVDYNDIVKNGTGAGKHITNGGEDTSANAVAAGINRDSRWEDIAIFPPNFDTTGTDTYNPNWDAPTKVLLLAFVDESDPIYHKDAQYKGFNEQPTPYYYSDFRRFRDNLDSHWEFFRGVFYPIPPDTGQNEGLAVVMQGFAAIEGGATYTAQEMEALGMIDVVERGYDKILDVNHSEYTGGIVANPYSPQAQNAVPDTDYNLQGLKSFGWYGIYDKVQPASSVFSAGTFQQELGEFLQGSTETTNEKRIVEGECTDVGYICFDFKTSDDSDLNLFSNTATFCLNLSTDNNPPNVEDNSAALRLKEYTFSTGSFTKNFYDPDGDSYSRVTIKSLPKVGRLKAIGSEVEVGSTFTAISANNISFELTDRYAIYNGIVHDFGKSIDEIIKDYKDLGYNLSSNSSGKLTFTKSDNSGNTHVVQGSTVSNSNLCFNFTTSDNSQLKQESNVAKFCLIPEGNINIKPIFENEPPIVGDNTITVRYDEVRTLTQSYFIDDTTPRYSDPEGDSPSKLKVLTVPPYGQLLLNSNPIEAGDIIDFADINANNFKYAADSSRTDIESTSFEFAVSDTGSNKFTE